MTVPEEFYPTPTEVIRRMVGPYRDGLEGRTILEPSAGSGAMLDYICKEISHSSWKCAQKSKVYAIEPDPDLVFMLQGKGYKVIGHDFLSYEPRHWFDLVIMNPPFSNGDQHLLKAWEILEEGDICCLLNAETIRNPYTRQRRLLLDIIEANGEYEFLGNCFRNASRKTDVDVAMVRLKKKAKTGRFRFDFGHDSKMEKVELPEDIESTTSVARNDQMAAYIRAYHKSLEAYVEYQKALEKLKMFMNAYLDSNRVASIIKTADELPSIPTRYNAFLDEVRGQAWKEIIKKMEVEKYLTNSVYKDFSNFVAAQGAMELNKDNINGLVLFLLNNRDGIMDKAIEDVFDLFTKYHECNRCHIEGWKTNSAWKVNKKVILPYFLELGYSGKYNINYRRWDEYSDIDKVMAYITGKDLKEVRTLKQTITDIRIGDSGLYESEFFMVRCFKKCTLHITFRDEWLWAEFNIRACKMKKWIGN